MQIAEYVRMFIDIYNAGAALIIVFFIGHILFMMRKVDKFLLRAKLFLNEAATERTWMYISIAGASFALNSLLKIIGIFTPLGSILDAIYAVEITQLIFLVSFMLAVYNWYEFIGSFSKMDVKKAMLPVNNQIHDKPA